MRCIIFWTAMMFSVPVFAETPSNLKVDASAKTTASGLKYIVLKKGKGTTKPGKNTKVKVHYTGWQLSDGKRFDSSVDRGQPASFRLNQVIAGWTEGVQLMVEGEIRRFWIPGNLAYGDKPQNGRPSGTLVFDIELIEIEDGPKHLKAPANLKPPKNATVTKSGLFHVLLKKGTGATRPTPTSKVRVHYSGWQSSDGWQFDSSVARGFPDTFPLNRVIKGWSEGLQLMVVGEKRRFWIPARLAYGNKGSYGRPTGMLVFDVELLGID